RRGWRVKSARKTCARGRRRGGRDSILVRLSRALANGSRIRWSVPTSSRMEKKIEGLSRARAHPPRGPHPQEPRLVAAGAARRAAPDRQEPRHVVRVVLDPLAEGRDPVELPGQLAGDGG